MGDKHGFFSGLRSRFERNRLGELLVQRGKMTPDQLRIALQQQKETGACLGQVVRNLNFVSQNDIRYTLLEQASYRALAAIFAVFIGFTSVSTIPVKASPYNNRANTQAMVYKAAYHPNESITIAPDSSPQAHFVHPDLFGTREVASSDISAFKKWTGVLAKLDKISFQSGDIEQFASLPLSAKISAVNSYVNKVSYIEDKNNFGKSDYWATPTEFFARGGDCEDFAIAKYALLKELGVPEEEMRLAIVQDTVKNVPHAILIVYTQTSAMVLDNQDKMAKDIVDVTRYKPIYSINAEGWWRHLS